MPPERRRGDDPAEWLRRAKSNLLRAREDIRLPEVAKEDLCCDAQQAAEKAIKAVLIHRGIHFPYIHDLAALLDLVEERGTAIPPHVKEAARLTRFAVETRYPSLDEPVTHEEYERALAIAEAVFRWAEKEIG
ncbi:MAG: HEPN domain-containing protein [candidate division NC10 bacterium]|nr:HEPN domain-containing protein [candidate division NC10 bacterium]